MKPCPKPEKRGKSRKRRAPSERVRLERELDALVSLIVRARDGKCVTCGDKENLTCSHYYGRQKKRLRYDLQNCNAQCAGCNGRHNHYPGYYTAYMLRRYGAETFRALTDLACLDSWKWSVVELRGMLEELRAGQSE